MFCTAQHYFTWECEGWYKLLDRDIAPVCKPVEGAPPGGAGPAVPEIVAAVLPAGLPR